MAGLPYGFNANQNFDTSSLMGPVAADQSIMGYLANLYRQPTDFSGVNNLFSTLMSPALRLGPNGVMLDPRQTQANASDQWLGARANAAGANQGQNQAYQGMFGNLLNKYAGGLTNIQSLNTAANAPTPGVLGLFGSLLGG
jgi:hypothetical protein